MAHDPMERGLRRGGGRTPSRQRFLAKHPDWDAFEIDLSGVDGVLDALDKIGRGAAGNALLHAVKKAMHPAMLSARSNARKIKDTGLLAKSIQVKGVKYQGGSIAVAIVGPATKFRRIRRQYFGLNDKGESKEITIYQDPTKYAHLVEFGTQAHDITVPIEGGKTITFRHPGSTPKAFLRPAWDSNKTKVLQIFKDVIWGEIEKAPARYARSLQYKAAGKARKAAARRLAP